MASSGRYFNNKLREDRKGPTLFFKRCNLYNELTVMYQYHIIQDTFMCMEQG
jgi:hypothetical protein